MIPMILVMRLSDTAFNDFKTNGMTHHNVRSRRDDFDSRVGLLQTTPAQS